MLKCEALIKSIMLYFIFGIRNNVSLNDKKKTIYIVILTFICSNNSFKMFVSPHSAATCRTFLFVHAMAAISAPLSNRYLRKNLSL